MDFKFRLIKTTELNLIKPLWNELNNIHLNDSHFFKEHYKNFTFEKRCENFNKTDSSNIRIEIINADKDIPIGYCISTVTEETGEIDSLFIDSTYRNNELGKKLVQNSLDWFKSKNCKKIVVSVAEGHESAFGFYEQFGFYPRLTYLQLKE